MNEDTKEQEIFTDDRNRSRFKTQSPMLQLQQKLEEIKQIEIDHENKRIKELFIKTLFEFIKSFDNVDNYILKDIKATTDTQEDEHIQVQTFQILYNDALQTIFRQEHELNQARLQCNSMAMKLTEYEKKYSIDAHSGNCNDVEKEITPQNIGDTTKGDEIFTAEFKESQNMDSYVTESDCSVCGSNSEDYKLISNTVTFRPIDEYEPIVFKKYIRFNEHICEEYDGLQSDWESNDDGYQLQYSNESEHVEEDEDECIGLVNALGMWRRKFDALERENEMLRSENIQHLKTIDDIWNKYHKKCIEYENLKCKLTSNNLK